jgi:hypothetical protein
MQKIFVFLSRARGYMLQLLKKARYGVFLEIGNLNKNPRIQKITIM